MVGVILCALLLLAASPMAARAKADGGSPSPRPAAGAPSDGEAKEVIVDLFGHHRDFQLELFPTKGVAVVDTYERHRQRISRSVAYATAVSAAPFSDSVDLTFPGLGQIVGTVSRIDPLGPAAQAKNCEEDEIPSESATFEGHLAFRGDGGYGRWAATNARASIQLACGRRFRRENGRAALFDHVGDFGLVLNGPAAVRMSVEAEVGPHRSVQFFAWGGRDLVEFDAIDTEWLPGGVATLRWAKKEEAPRKTVAIRSDDAGPVSARLTPPAPFFGKGIYRRSTGDLTGSIGVDFLGLKLRVTPSPSPLILEDEEGVERSLASGRMLLPGGW